MRTSSSLLAAAACASLMACGGSAEPASRGASGVAPGSITGPGSAAPGAGAAVASAGSAPAAGSAAAPAGPPVTVTTVRAQKRDLPVLLSATGSVAPLSSVDVRPQVTSVITQVHIREGQFVKTGQMLFTLDSRTDEANVARARAQLAKDEVTLADAQRQLARSRDLLAQNFISQGAVDANQALVDSQLAVINANRAVLDAARVTLSNARIVAPSGGRVGAINVFVGSSVQANQTALVNITQLDPIAVAFNLPQRHLDDALAALKGGGAAVTAQLPDKAGSLRGRLQFVDSAIDPASGTVKVKAVFPNPQTRLWPGAFLDVAMNVRTLKDATVIPQAAIIQSARGPIVYAAENGKAALRPVQIVLAQGDDAAVSGVRPGEAIVLDGRQNLRPGTSVVERAREGGARAGGGAAGGGARPASGPTTSGPPTAPPTAPVPDAAGPPRASNGPRQEKPAP
jgi:RND family efflux transporter MFP subunit